MLSSLNAPWRSGILVHKWNKNNVKHVDKSELQGHMMTSVLHTIINVYRHVSHPTLVAFLTFPSWSGPCVRVGGQVSSLLRVLARLAPLPAAAVAIRSSARFVFPFFKKHRSHRKKVGRTFPCRYSLAVPRERRPGNGMDSKFWILTFL